MTGFMSSTSSISHLCWWWCGCSVCSREQTEHPHHHQHKCDIEDVELIKPVIGCKIKPGDTGQIKHFDPAQSGIRLHSERNEPLDPLANLLQGLVGMVLQ